MESDFQFAWVTYWQHSTLQATHGLSTLYNLRAKWCSIFSHDTFICRTKSFERSESTNNVFHKMSTKIMSVTDLCITMINKQKKCVQLNWKKLILANKDFILKFPNYRGTPLASPFKRKRSWWKAWQWWFVRLEVVVEFIHMNLMRRVTTAYRVQLNSLCCTISCTCKMFESLGLLCSHALKVLHVNARAHF